MPNLRNNKIHKPTAGKTKVATSAKAADNKQCRIESGNTDKCKPNETTDSEQIWEKFELELMWCLQQLQSQLDSKRLNPKQTEQTAKILTTLANPKTPLVKKRQVMRTTFGDYRSKMKQEETKLDKAMKRMCMSEVKADKYKGTFVRKCVEKKERDDEFLSHKQEGSHSYHFKRSDNSFRFNFSSLENAST